MQSAVSYDPIANVHREPAPWRISILLVYNFGTPASRQLQEAGFHL